MPHRASKSPSDFGWFIFETAIAMTLEIHKPEREALILERIAGGADSRRIADLRPEIFSRGFWRGEATAESGRHSE
jgi:hypothetical protein